jgi:hypothetical protein
MKCAQTLEVGAYVLGALSPAERDAFERHLGECAICRDEVADLAVLPGLLGRIDAATAMAVARDGEEHSVLPSSFLADASESGPSAWAGPTAAGRWAGPTAAAEPSGDATAAGPEPGRWAGPTVTPDTDAEPAGSNVISLLDAAARRQAKQKRRRRFTTVAAGLAAACLAVAVGLGAPRVLDGDDQRPDLVAMSQTGAGTVPVAAELAIQPTVNGARVIMHCTYKNKIADLEMWWGRLVLVQRDGTEESVGDWNVGFGDEVEVDADTTLKPSDIDRIELRNKDNKPILVYTNK